MMQLSAPTGKIKSSLAISGSKSISNRLLMINEISGAGITFENLSGSEDTQLLHEALAQIRNNKSATININHAGTDMRFLTALLSVTKGSWTLTGSERLKERPVGALVKALKTLGADIVYLEKENFPPLKITGKQLTGGKIEIDAGVSSQFISALLLIAPLFEKGLQLSLKGNVVSRPYINMTIALLKEFGIKISEHNNEITVFPSSIFPLPPDSSRDSIAIESDWSSASYWYSICALSPNSEIELSNFNENSLQADAILPKLYDSLGVQTVFKNNSILLSNKKRTAGSFKYDFTNCPDIAQTLAVTCFGLGIEATLTGLQTLKLKETDRIAALKHELEKLEANITATNNTIHIAPSSFFHSSSSIFHLPSAILFNTYHDHRMAMSFAPLALLYPEIKIENPKVVDKSYPRFWEDLESVGFNVNLQT